MAATSNGLARLGMIYVLSLSLLLGSLLPHQADNTKTVLSKDKTEITWMQTSRLIVKLGNMVVFNY